MAFQIPKGDNLGNVGPQVGRTRIQGGDSPIGRTMVGFGRDVQRIGLQLEQEKEQVNQVEMRNAVLNREKQVNGLKNSIDERVKMGDLDPESAVEEYKKQLATLPKQEIKGLNNKQQETLNYYYNATDYQGEQQALGIYKQGITVKAQNALSEYARLANEDPNNNIDMTLAGIDSEAMQQTFKTAYGQKADETKAQFKRELLFNNLQNKTTLAADSSNYKALKQLKADAMNGDFYKGILQNDDRVKLAHLANVNIDRLESKWKTDAALAKANASLAYSSLKENLYSQMARDGKTFDQLDANQLAQLKASDYDFFRSYQHIKHDDTTIYAQALNDINNGKDINLTDKQYQANLTPSSIKSLTVKQQTLKADAKEQQDLFSSNQLFNTQAKVFGVRTGTEDFMRLQNETNEAIRLESEKQGRKLTSQEKERVINDQFVKGVIKNGGIFIGDSWEKMRFQVDKKDRANFVVEKESNIPDPIKKELTKRLEARGVKPTPELLLGAYNAYLKGNN